jgi:sugar fermentation stimulation protein A
MKILLKIENYEKGVIIERLNRFVVKVKIKNRLTLAHLNNTGRLEDFLKKEEVGLFLPINADYADSTQTAPTKLKFRLSMIKESKNIYSVIDTQLQMKCFEIALKKGYISWLRGAKILKRNFMINHSLIDYLIQHKNKKYLLEIKSAVMKYKNFAMYPDCSSIRGQKHIKELIDIQTLQTKCRLGRNKNLPRYKPDISPGFRPDKSGNYPGNSSGRYLGNQSSNHPGQPSGKNPGDNMYPYKSMVLFIAGMKNISAFSPNKNADPKIYELLKIAKNKGVKIKAIQIYFDEKRKSIILKNDNLPVIL